MRSRSETHKADVGCDLSCVAIVPKSNEDPNSSYQQNIKPYS